MISITTDNICGFIIKSSSKLKDTFSLLLLERVQSYSGSMQERIVKNFILWFFLLFSTTIYAENRKIVIAGDYWCPYNCYPDDKEPGYLIELATKIFSIYGVAVEYKLMPWSEAVNKVDKGEIDAIIGISFPSRNLLTTTKPQGYSTTGVFTRTGSIWVFDGIESLNGKVLAMILDYNLGNSIREYIATVYPKNPNAFVLESGQTPIISAINQLLENKADVYIEDKAVVNHYIQNNNLQHAIRNAGTIYDEAPIPLFIAVSKKANNADLYIKMLEEGMSGLEATGDLEDLRAKYFVNNH